MQIFTLRTSYKVYGDSFLPLRLIHDAGIVAEEVYSSKCFHCFQESRLKEEKQHGVNLTWSLLFTDQLHYHQKSITIYQHYTILSLWVVRPPTWWGSHAQRVPWVLLGGPVCVLMLVATWQQIESWHKTLAKRDCGKWWNFTILRIFKENIQSRISQTKIWIVALMLISCDNFRECLHLEAN